MAHLDPAEPYDIIFIDAQKSGYPRYLESIISKSLPNSSRRLLRPGGLIIGDNALRAGLVADGSDANPASKILPHVIENWNWDDVTFLDQFNQTMKTHPRLETVLLPLFDGLGIARLLD